MKELALCIVTICAIMFVAGIKQKPDEGVCLGLELIISDTIIRIDNFTPTYAGTFYYPENDTVQHFTNQPVNVFPINCY